MSELVNTTDASSTASMYFSMSCQCLANLPSVDFFFQILVVVVVVVVRYSREEAMVSG